MEPAKRRRVSAVCQHFEENYPNKLHRILYFCLLDTEVCNYYSANFLLKRLKSFVSQFL